jgi:hypothetical protein
MTIEERVHEQGERDVAASCRPAVELRLDDVAVVVPSLRLRRESATGVAHPLSVVPAKLPLAGRQLADVATGLSWH